MMEFATRRCVVIGANWEEPLQWCKDHLYHGGHYEARWSFSYPVFQFEDEQEYLAFVLRWS